MSICFGIDTKPRQTNNEYIQFLSTTIYTFINNNILSLKCDIIYLFQRLSYARNVCASHGLIQPLPQKAIFRNLLYWSQNIFSSPLPTETKNSRMGL